MTQTFFRAIILLIIISALSLSDIPAEAKSGKNKKNKDDSQVELGREQISTIHHILSTGQSLSVGYASTPKLTISQPYNNMMLDNALASFTSLIEPGVNAAGPNHESPWSATGNMLTLLAGQVPNYTSVITMHGQSGTAYAGLKKGTVQYNKGLAQVSAAKNIADSLEIPYKVSAVTTVHGESDEIGNKTSAQYKAYLEEWQNDYQTDVNAITGQTGILPMFTDQMHSWTGTNINKATSKIVIGQWLAARDNPEKIFLVTPKYIFDYQDNLHLKNYSSRRLGEYYGKVMKKVLVDGEPWLPLSPISVNRFGSSVYATFHVPVAPLVFDTTAVDAVSNYGFEYFDSNNSASIVAVNIIDSDTVKIDLSAIPTGANQRLRYAYTGVPGSKPGAHVVGSPKGNLRDSDSTSAYYTSGIPAQMGTTLPNWAITFDEPITQIEPTISSVAVYPSENDAVITWNTNFATQSIIEYSLITDSTYAQTAENTGAGSVFAHSVSINGLDSNTKYHFRIKIPNEPNPIIFYPENNEFITFDPEWGMGTRQSPETI